MIIVCTSILTTRNKRYEFVEIASRLPDDHR